MNNLFYLHLKVLGLSNKLDIAKIKRKRVAGQRPIRKQERFYEKFLLSLIQSWKSDFLNSIYPHLRGIWDAASVLKPKIDSKYRLNSFDDDLEHLMNEYSLFLEGTIKPLGSSLKNIGKNVDKENTKQWQEVVKNLIGVPIFVNEPWLIEHIDRFVSQNITLITKLKDEVKADVTGTIQRGIAQGKRVETIKKEILGTKLEKGVFTKIEKRASLIARDQVNKLNGQLAELRQKEVGIDKYYWRTAFDERVRTSHVMLEGRLCRWDDSTKYSDDGGVTWLDRGNLGATMYHPGQDFQCRCWAEPYFEDILNQVKE